MVISSYIVNHLSHESMVDAKNNQKSIKKANTFFIRKFIRNDIRLGGLLGYFPSSNSAFRKLNARTSKNKWESSPQSLFAWQ